MAMDILDMTTKTRITVAIAEKNNNNGSNTATQMTIKTQTISK